MFQNMISFLSRKKRFCSVSRYVDKRHDRLNEELRDDRSLIELLTDAFPDNQKEIIFDREASVWNFVKKWLEENAKSFGPALQDLRKESGMTAAELSEKCKFDKKAVDFFENKGRMPRASSLKRLAAGLGYSGIGEFLYNIMMKNDKEAFYAKRLAAKRNQQLTGKFVKCLRMASDRPVPAGTEGKVLCVSEMGTIMVEWENGATLGLIPGLDEWKVSRA